MIEVIGVEGNPEYEAAHMVRDALVRLWPGIESTPASLDHVKIASRVKLSGQKISDIDIVVVALLLAKRYIIPKASAKDTDGNSIVGAKVRVRSFVVTIEVKDHPAENISIQAGGVRVKYKDGWKDATNQNEEQRYSLVNYLREVNSSNPWVYRCVMLRGINELPRQRGVPQPEAGAVAATFDGTTLLMAMASVNGIRRHGLEPTISSGDADTIEALLSDMLFQPLVPSTLDRKRMDRIASRPAEARELSQLLGHQRIHLRGNGGTGKTILLLQIAYDALRERCARSLVLTYNTALAADIQRTLALIGIPDDGEYGGITVRTVMSFVYSWLNRLGVASGNDIGFDDYEGMCAEALRYFEEGAISEAEVDAVKQASAAEFDFDAILVDEAQDWLQPEADLLARLYGANKLSLADGLSQLVRGQPTDWHSPAIFQQRSLREGLRMKANLCRFANALAGEAGIKWHVTPNRQASGGRVVLLQRSYAYDVSLQKEIIAAALSAGNMPIDILHCVPPSGVREEGGRRHSLLAKALAQNSWECWDAVDDTVRKTFPRSPDAFRVVQYESCRGLEGWTAVLEGLDEFWDLKYSAAIATFQNAGKAMIDPNALAGAVAWRWCMIPITRPIDTLVITIRDKESTVGRVMATLASTLPDIVEDAEHSGLGEWARDVEQQLCV